MVQACITFLDAKALRQLSAFLAEAADELESSTD